MAKKVEKMELRLSVVDYTPTKTVAGKKVQQVGADGTPVVYKIFSTKLMLLGKQTEFKIYTKEPTEKAVLLDFFALEGVNELPIEIIPVTFKNDKGETVTVYDVVCKLDDIHSVKLKPADVDRGRWSMAIRELSENYVLPKKYAKVRQERYEAAMAWKKNGSTSKIDKEEDLPF